MKQKTLWITTFTLLIAHLCLQYIVIRYYSLSNIADIVSFIVDLVGNIFAVVLLGGILGLLLALVPFQQKNYKQRFMYTFPISLSVILPILLIAFLYVYLYIAV